ncbi:MAG: hypothetical protein ACRDQW_05545 [Haloechinothrix sp.]
MMMSKPHEDGCPGTYETWHPDYGTWVHFCPCAGTQTVLVGQVDGSYTKVDVDRWLAQGRPDPMQDALDALRNWEMPGRRGN